MGERGIARFSLTHPSNLRTIRAMTLASIQPIFAVEHHNNADLLDVVTVKGYKAIVKRDQWKVGDLCVFIEPDSVLPDAPWSAFYRAKSNRVKAIRLRGVWSFGIVESPSILGDVAMMEINQWAIRAGIDVTEHLGVTKYEAPMPQDLNASGPYGFGIPKTDETRWQSIDDLPFGELCDVTLKIDGQSFSALATVNTLAQRMPMWGADGDTVQIEASAIGGRSFLYKLDCENHYTRNAKAHDVLPKLEAFCRERNVSLCIHGESYGSGIQKSSVNPHSKLPLGLAFYSTWLIDERRYANKGDPLYIHTIAPLMGLPTVPVIERDVVLTPELIRRYAEEMETLDGKPFEGVVIQHAKGSFKVIGMAYDSKH